MLEDFTKKKGNIRAIFVQKVFSKNGISPIILWLCIKRKNPMVGFSMKLTNTKGQFFNTKYMTNSTLVSPVKMEYGWNFSISGLGKIFLKFLHALTMSFLLLNFDQSTNSVIKITWWAHGGISKIFFLDHFSSSFLGQKY